MNFLNIKKNDKNKPSVCAIVPSAGTGSRMKMQENKLYIKICGKEVIAHTITALENSEYIDEIIIVTSESEIANMNSIVKEYNFNKVKKIIRGGETRTESVKKGLAEAVADYVAVHDGARPCVTAEDIDNVIKKAIEFRTAVLGTKAIDTIKISDDNGFVSNTLNRDYVWQIQTPQVFEKNILLSAYNADTTGGTDDCVLVERLGIKIPLVEGSRNNIKITTTEDLAFAETILKGRVNL